jgi:hypothetical protein
MSIIIAILGSILIGVIVHRFMEDQKAFNSLNSSLDRIDTLLNRLLLEENKEILINKGCLDSPLNEDRWDMHPDW